MSFASPSATVPWPPSSSGLGDPTRTYAWAGVALLAALVLYSTLRKGPYDTIPAVGGTDLVSSYIGAIRAFKSGKDIVQEGYNKCKSGVFRVPQLNRWMIIVSGKKLIEELRKAPDDTLSFMSAVEEDLLSKYTLGADVLLDKNHNELVRVQLTRNLPALYPDVRDEIVRAFDDNVPRSEDWSKFTAYPLVLQIVSRTSNRVFVGAPVCRNPDYTALTIKHTMDVVKGALIISVFPNLFKPLAARFLTRVPQTVDLAFKYLGPIIEERERMIDEHGVDYPDKPNDFLSWLMDDSEGMDRLPRKLTIRILGLNFAAIHTSSMSFTHALFHLASRPEYLEPLRKEIETVVAEEGWTKVAMVRMRKLDSFLKESQRFNGLGALSITRKALKDYTFSDGTHIPKGAMVSAPSTALHHDDEFYANGDTFDGFRFSDIREQDGQGLTNQFTATSPNYIPFGHGRHSCPGRFFAANELKLMMAHLVLTYDIKMENEGVRPKNTWIGFSCMVDTNAKVLFKRRQAS